MFDRDEIVKIGAVKKSGINDLFLAPTTEDLRGVMDNVIITMENENGKGESENDD